MTDSLLDAFDTAVAEHGPRTALVERDGRHVSFATLSGRARGFAAAWRARGLGRGDRVLVAMPLGADLYAALAGLWSLGATAVLPEPAMGLTGVRHAIRLAGCKGLVASGAYAWLRVLLPGLWFKPLYRPRAGATVAPFGKVDPDDIALISFTSGSTGIPKAIARSHAFLQAQRRAIAPLLGTETAPVDLVAFPVFALINLAAGRCSVLPNWRVQRPDLVEPQSLARWIEAQGVSRALLPPALVQKLGEAPLPTGLRTVFTGGGPVFPDMVARLQARDPGLRVIAVYGSTEAEPIAEIDMSALTPTDLNTMQEGGGLLAGHPVQGLEVRIGNGEILVAGPHVNPGYLDPARDAETKLREGDRIWHRTGDAGRLDASGRLWLLGRHGVEVAGLHPFAVETAARTWAGVAAAALCAIDDRPVLAIAGDAAHLRDWQTAASAFGPVTVRHVADIPMDRRHRSKVDYPGLRARLRNG